MKTYLSFLVIFSYLSMQISFAQDLHFTNYDYAPLYLNPAQTGDFSGTARFSGIYRDQFSRFIEEKFVSAMGAGETNFNFALRKRDWTSIGVAVFYDQAGELSLQNTGALVSGAYHYALDKKQNSVFTFAAQLSLFQRRIKGLWNPEDLILSGSTADLGLFENFSDNGSGTNFNTGVQYNSKLSKYNELKLGVSAYNILQPDEKQNIAPRRFNAHGSLFTRINNTIGLEYALFYSNATTNFNNLTIQVRSYFDLRKNKKIKRKSKNYTRGQFMFGLGYRGNDALLFLTGYEYKKWQLGISYDLNISSASKVFSSNYGAIELGIRRVFLITKQPEIKPVILCPHL